MYQRIMAEHATPEWQAAFALKQAAKAERRRAFEERLAARKQRKLQRQGSLAA